MTHVVAEPCFACKYTDCVVVCPVECFYEGEKMLYIHRMNASIVRLAFPNAQWKRFSMKTTYLRNGLPSRNSMQKWQHNCP